EQSSPRAQQLYRQSQNPPILANNDKAGCLADQIANKLEDQPCPAGRSVVVAQLSNYAKSMDKCDIGINRELCWRLPRRAWWLCVLTTGTPGRIFARAHRSIPMAGRVQWVFVAGRNAALAVCLR
ncbi:unnamed protein product, partial [Linum tenue]